MMHVGNDTTEESNWANKRTKKVHGMIENIQKQFQTYFVPGKNSATDESTVGFESKIIFRTYDTKKGGGGGHQIICISWQ
jgi:hypothetical protein